MNRRHEILLVTYPGAQILDVTGPAQMFTGTNEELGRDVYRVRIVAPDGAAPIPTSSGIRILPDLGLGEVTDELLSVTGSLIVAGGSGGLEQALATGEIADLVRRANGPVPRLASVCTGAFLLAAAGVLDGRRATTHWQSAARLQRFRPQITVEPDAIYIRDDTIWTSAGVTAGIDLALAMIEADHDKTTALAVARQHVMFRIRPGGQSQFSADLMSQAAPVGELDGLVEAIAAGPDQNWSVDRLAEEACMSVRTLTRRFRKIFSTSPAEFVERVRLDLARRAILETDISLSSIAADAGFGSLRRMDRAFARVLQTSPTDFRNRFKSMENNHEQL
ncbi:MAG: helix-turn-helix domain-containing protein [Rhodospirillales bacterium]